MRVIFLQDVPRVGKKTRYKRSERRLCHEFFVSAESWPNQRLRKQLLYWKKERKNRDRKGSAGRLLLKNLEEIKGKIITIKGKANEKGNLFSAIHKKEIVEEMEKQHTSRHQRRIYCSRKSQSKK